LKRINRKKKKKKFEVKNGKKTKKNRLYQDKKKINSDCNKNKKDKNIMKTTNPALGF